MTTLQLCRSGGPLLALAVRFGAFLTVHVPHILDRHHQQAANLL